MTFRRAERERHAGIEITKNIQDYSRQKGRTERKKIKIYVSKCERKNTTV